MKYIYKTVKDIIEIEVDEPTYKILCLLDKEERNSNRRHSRRTPVSLEHAGYEGEWFSDGSDVLEDLIRKEEKEQLHTALHKLTPAAQELIRNIYFKNMKIADIAKKEGVTHTAIQNRLKRIYIQLKKAYKEKDIL